jgi:signal transduction histidine kinase
MRVAERAARYLDSWRADAVTAAALAAITVGVVASEGLLRGTNNLLETAAGATICGSIVARRRYPYLAALVAGSLLALTDLGSIAALPYPVVFGSVCLLGYSLGTAADLRASVAALLVLGAGFQVADGATVFNPFVIVIIVGSWSVGLVVRSRRNLTDQLTARGRELENERVLFAAEAVRYERARIARELHDIVAHCVSVMVIQASAGQRLTATDPALAAQAFDSIAEVAQQAEAEISRLVDLLEHEPQPHSGDAMQLIGELVARAGAAGLAVSCRFSGTTAVLPAVSSDAAYRVAQESLTNAFKYAPGAPVEITVTGSADDVQISVVNGPMTGRPSGLELTGGGRGLTGMRERVESCGGDIAAGLTQDGGWHVRARLPVHDGSGS